MRTSTRLHPFRSTLILAAACLLGAACTSSETPAPETESTTATDPGLDVQQRAQDALQPLKRRLMGELTAALSEGPVNAIEVCSVVAPDLAAQVAPEGMRIGRTSHRLRNPANAPEPWMEPLLAAYVADSADRAPHTVRIDERTMGYVEPIVAQEMCLACHGKNVDAAVATALAERYPEDQATGFEAGELRGMFWVTVPVEGG